MAVWELALLLVAVTYLMVNTVYLVMQVKLMAQMKGVYTKSFKILEKMMDKTEPFIDKMLDEMDEF